MIYLNWATSTRKAPKRFPLLEYERITRITTRLELFFLTKLSTRREDSATHRTSNDGKTESNTSSKKLSANEIICSKPLN